MHLAFLTPEFPHALSTPSGGLGTSIKNMVEVLSAKGIGVSVFIYGQKQNKIITEGDIKFYFIKKQHYNFLGWYLHRKHLQKYLNKIIFQEKIDAIEVPDWIGITAFMKIKCPVIMRFHGSDSYFCHLEDRPQKKKNFWFEKKAIEGADHLISVSHFTSEITKNLFNIKRKVKIIPNSVDINYFRPNTTNIEKDTILYFGSIIRKKGVLELAEIFNIISKEKPKAKLLFAGKDIKDKLTGLSTKQLIKGKLSPFAKKNVEWLGILPYEKVLEMIAMANVVALPSFAEALPMTWLESMAMEKALVTSHIGWASEVMKDGETGFAVDPKNHGLYAEKVLQLLNDSDLAGKMGKAARKRIVETFSNEVVVEQNIKFYKAIVAGNSTNM